MGVDLMMEPYATKFREQRPGSRIIDEFCFPDIDKLFGRLRLRWDEYSVDALNGRLPHDAALSLLAAVEPHQALAEKLLTLLLYYRQWYEHPDRVPGQMQQFVGTVPGMAGRIRSYLDEHPSERIRLVLS
jgi:hypothetical protein